MGLCSEKVMVWEKRLCTLTLLLDKCWCGGGNCVFIFYVWVDELYLLLVLKGMWIQEGSNSMEEKTNEDLYRAEKYIHRARKVGEK